MHVYFNRRLHGYMAQQVMPRSCLCIMDKDSSERFFFVISCLPYCGVRYIDSSAALACCLPFLSTICIRNRTLLHQPAMFNEISTPVQVMYGLVLTNGR
jgi:hypothetical protein